MYAKIIDGKLIVAGKKIKIENGWITNPTEEDLKKNGYKEIEYTEKPTYDKENEKLVEVYTDGETIQVSYEKVALTVKEHNEVILQKIYIEEGKITSRNIRNAIKGDEFALSKITEVENNIANLRNKLSGE